MATAPAPRRGMPLVATPGAHYNGRLACRCGPCCSLLDQPRVVPSCDRVAGAPWAPRAPRGRPRRGTGAALVSAARLSPYPPHAVGDCSI
ncbi:hypothetical protein BU14_0457s0009 [Porphyra umbilicalis]|uniref:Uncharacterized protein n=1 Tax=Porphyra umbilicalis TaxID=2786 RepID=A0A1X6NUN8_PORUM|nr:hypothetical protein BU14_0457s0009 [Porphyra umbilicalis]|eukprot:OSX72216.1 hypothetical protein BU14_0457s0009 [Porphyra umbilicalis]